MIYEILANTNPMNLSGMSTNVLAGVQAFTTSIEAEFCTSGCDYREFAFHDASTTEEWKNDKSSFLVRRNALTETWTFKLFKDGLYLATMSSDAYGEYSDFGDLTYSYLKGLVIYWRLVFLLHGNGDYHVRIERTFAGTTTGTDSHIYMVRPYSFTQAKDTVKLESIQNGTFVGTGLTLRGMNWYQSIRMPGKFWNKQPRIETQEYINTSRQRTKIRDVVVNTYSLELRMLPNFISNEVVYNQIIANSLYITDYNINNEVYRKWPVRIKDIPGAEYYQKNPRGNFEFTFYDRSMGTIQSY